MVVKYPWDGPESAIRVGRGGNWHRMVGRNERALEVSACGLSLNAQGGPKERAKIKEGTWCPECWQ